MAQGSAQVWRTDQATRLRELARRHRRRAEVVAILSGKGGVGKSTIAVNLSVCMASRGLRVVLVDVDMGLANADLLLNLQPRYTLSHVVSGVRTVEEVATEGPAGMRFIAGASGLPGLADLSEFERRTLISRLRKLQTSTDIVVLDCGAGIGRNVISFALAADRVVVITTPQPTSLTDAYAMIKALHREACPGRLGVFVNMANSRAEATGAFGRLSQVSRRFLNYAVADDGFMLHDTAVESAVWERCPFVVRNPGSNASACIASLADAMPGRTGGAQRRGGFLSRVAGLFV